MKPLLLHNFSFYFLLTFTWTFFYSPPTPIAMCGTYIWFLLHSMQQNFPTNIFFIKKVKRKFISPLIRLPLNFPSFYCYHQKNGHQHAEQNWTVDFELNEVGLPLSSARHLCYETLFVKKCALLSVKKGNSNL